MWRHLTYRGSMLDEHQRLFALMAAFIQLIAAWRDYLAG
jgi:hypothetical protein